MKKHASSNFQLFASGLLLWVSSQTFHLIAFFFLPYWRCMKEHISLWLMPVKHSSPAAPLMETQVRIIIRMPDWWGWLLPYLKYGKLSGSDCSLFVYFLVYNVNRRGLITHPALGHSGIQEWKMREGICFCSRLVLRPPHSVFCINQLNVLHFCLRIFRIFHDRDWWIQSLRAGF